MCVVTRSFLSSSPPCPCLGQLWRHWGGNGPLFLFLTCSCITRTRPSVPSLSLSLLLSVFWPQKGPCQWCVCVRSLFAAPLPPANVIDEIGSRPRDCRGRRLRRPPLLGMVHTRRKREEETERERDSWRDGWGRALLCFGQFFWRPVLVCLVLSCMSLFLTHRRYGS